MSDVIETKRNCLIWKSVYFYSIRENLNEILKIFFEYKFIKFKKSDVKKFQKNFTFTLKQVQVQLFDGSKSDRLHVRVYHVAHKRLRNMFTRRNTRRLSQFALYLRIHFV